MSQSESPFPRAPGFIQQEFRAKQVRIEQLEQAIREALSELGVPTADYAAPVGNAVGLLRAALDDGGTPVGLSEDGVPAPPPSSSADTTGQEGT